MMDISTYVQKGKRAVIQHSPEILVISGVCELITGAVLACRASMKVKDVLDQFHARLAYLDGYYSTLPEDSEKAAKQAKEEKRAVREAYIWATKELAKLYGVSIALGVGGTVSILCGAGILKKRNAALAAAYATLDTSYREYRKRVEDKYGAEAEQEIRLGTHEEKIEIVETSDDGKEKVVKKKVQVSEGELSGYARVFDVNNSVAAEPNFHYNETFLVGQQEVANRLLKAKGFLYLNDVYEMLGYDRSVAGQEVGWVYDKNSDHAGDNYVDFRIEVVHRQNENGEWVKVHTIDPNVDGAITNRLVKLNRIDA